MIIKDVEVVEYGSFSAKDYHDLALIVEFIATLLFLYIMVLTVIDCKSQTIENSMRGCLRAICGVSLVKAFQSTYYNRYRGGANKLTTGYSKGIGLGVEIIRTFVLVYTVFSTTDPKRSVKDSHVPVLAPLPIRKYFHQFSFILKLIF
ncbi:hypothetical protein AAG906_005430 [Vitis piasezkii]